MARNKTQPRQNALDLRSPLTGSQIQKKDPNLFQTINQLLDQVQKLQDRVTAIEKLLNPDINNDRFQFDRTVGI